MKTAAPLSYSPRSLRCPLGPLLALAVLPLATLAYILRKSHPRRAVVPLLEVLVSRPSLLPLPLPTSLLLLLLLLSYAALGRVIRYYSSDSSEREWSMRAAQSRARAHPQIKRLVYTSRTSRVSEDVRRRGAVCRYVGRCSEMRIVVASREQRVEIPASCREWSRYLFRWFIRHSLSPRPRFIIERYCAASLECICNIFGTLHS